MTTSLTPQAMPLIGQEVVHLSRRLSDASEDHAVNVLQHGADADETNASRALRWAIRERLEAIGYALEYGCYPVVPYAPHE